MPFSYYDHDSSTNEEKRLLEHSNLLQYFSILGRFPKTNQNRFPKTKQKVNEDSDDTEI